MVAAASAYQKSLLAAEREAEGQASGLTFTAIPWVARQDKDGKWQKVPVIGRGWHYQDLPYGIPAIPYEKWGFDGYDRWGQEIWLDDVQDGYVVSPRSGVIVLDQDKPGFFDWLRSIGIELPDDAPLVSTGKPDGLHMVFDGRHLTREQWPAQRNYCDGLGDVKSHGFVAAPGALHPSGRRYKLVRPGTPPHWKAEWSALLDEQWEADRRAADRGSSPRRVAGAGRSPGRRDGGEGSGRNNDLYRFKKELFYDHGLDEDDPELARRVFARNDQFAEPLSEAEIQATVLQHKGLKRRWILGVMPGAADDGHKGGPSEAEDREQEAGLAQAFSPTAGGQGVLAGQGSVWRMEEGSDLSSKHHADLRGREEPWSPCVALSAPADLKAKWAAELDGHALSRDWDQRGGERARTGYGWVMQQLIVGIEVRREQIEDQIWECLSRKSPNGAVLLSDGEDGRVIAWSDPRPDQATEDRDPWPSYPGCPEARNPKAGPYVGRKLGEHAVKAAWAAQGGERATSRMLTTWINTHRAELGMESPEDPLGCRYMHIENARRITRELHERGELKKTKDEEHYRRMHQWRTLPAAYMVEEDLRFKLAYQVRRAFDEKSCSSRRSARRHRHRAGPERPPAASLRREVANEPTQ